MTHYLRTLACLLAMLLVVLSCGSDPELDLSSDFVSDGGATAAEANANAPIAAEAIEVLFSPFDEPEKRVLAELAAARREVLIAHYNIRSQRVLDALVALHRRGVDVRVAVDLANAQQDYNTGDDLLERAGIPLVRTKPPRGTDAIMHLKASVIDGFTVMTGSYNWNNTAALVNDENLIIARDERLAATYRAQILEVLTQSPRTVVGTTAVPGIGLHFVPEQRVDSIIRQAIDGATSTVDVAMFTLTVSSVGDALLRAMQRGVRVRLVIERKQTDLTDIDERLEAAGALVLRGANRLGDYSAMHHKYAVIDGRTVITGAANWTGSGTRYNDEDLLVIDDAAMAAAYATNFGDLLYVYAGTEDARPASVQAPTEPAVVFRAIDSQTAWGDRLVVTGGHPALGNWDPRRGIYLDATDIFPHWAAVAHLPAGTMVPFKFVVIRGSGAIQWEPGPNREVQLSASGRPAVVSGVFGDTSKTWTPRDER